MELPGVGPYIADRIIVYRERLGGFINKEQLMEIKKIDLELFNKLEGQIVIDKEKITKLKINSASAEELKNHPYLNWSIANSIVKMRAQRGGTFKQVEELLESVLIDRELFEKIKPYLSL
jgi:competence protein ComEA